MPNGQRRGVKCNPAVVARLHLFGGGSQDFMINDCGCNGTRHQREVFFLLLLRLTERELEKTGICPSWPVFLCLLIGFAFHYHSIKALTPFET